MPRPISEAAGTCLGFAGGAKAVRPEVQVLQAYLGQFEDVAAAKEDALERDSITAGTLRVAGAEFMPDSVPVARR